MNTMRDGSVLYPRLLHIKEVIEQLTAMRGSMILTERERYVVEECLAQAYDRAAALLTELGDAHPGLIPLCLLASITLTIIYEKSQQEEVEEEISKK